MNMKALESRDEAFNIFEGNFNLQSVEREESSRRKLNMKTKIGWVNKFKLMIEKHLIVKQFISRVSNCSCSINW